jgi:hypothetical protein
MVCSRVLSAAGAVLFALALRSLPAYTSAETYGARKFSVNRFNLQPITMISGDVSVCPCPQLQNICILLFRILEVFGLHFNPQSDYP